MLALPTDTLAVMETDRPLSADEEKLLAELLERHQATEGATFGGPAAGRDLRGTPWMVAWIESPPGWAYFYHRKMPSYLRVSVRVGLTPDGVAAEAVLIERIDGQAVTAQDLRKVKLPQPWMLARGRELADQGGEPTVTAGRAGARGKDDGHWREVLRLLAEARRVAPRTPTRWMCEQWPGHVSDATMRRWIRRAQERARVMGWEEDHR
jgi:hypothetical protein